MNPQPPHDAIPAVKDDEQRAVPTAWRPTISAIVSRLVQRDYELSAAVPGVEPVTADTAAQIAGYIRDYGEELIELPDSTWDTSVCMWAESRWDVFVDLWTRGEGRSDLVLHLNVRESAGEVRFEVHLVYVP